MTPSEKLPFLTVTDTTCTIKVLVQPKSSKNSIEGIQRDALKIKLTAAPVEGEANKALVAYLSKKLKIKKNHIEIKKGLTSKTKLVQIRGVESKELERILKKLLTK